MDQLLASTVAQDGFDFTTLVADDTACVGGRIGAQTARDLGAVEAAQDDRVAALELALDRGYARRQQTLAGAQRPPRALVQNQGAAGFKLAAM